MKKGLVVFLLLCLFAASASAELRTYTYGGSGKDALRAGCSGRGYL